MSIQQTLTGTELDTDDTVREIPSTMLYCPECDDWLLRSNRFDHPDSHAPVVPEHSDRQWCTDCDEWLSPREQVMHDDDHSFEETPPKVGAKYQMRESFNVEYSVTVVAPSKHQAKKKAKAKIRDENIPAAEKFHVHSDRTKLGDVYADDPEADDIEYLP